MSGVRKKSWEGDLFPRGAALTATPRIRKRDGQVLFAPPTKRLRTRPNTDDPVDQPVTRNGAMMSWSRLTEGMTLVAVVTRADIGGVWFALPGGIRAVGMANEAFVEKKIVEKVFEVMSESEGDTESESDEEEERVVYLWEVVKVGDVVRVCVVAVEKEENRKLVKVSMKPELVNVGLNSTWLLRKGFGVVGVVESVEDHGCVVSFGGHVIYKGFMEGEGGQVGEVVEVVTLKETKKAKRSVVKVSKDREKVLKAEVEGEIGLADLRAGMLLRGVVGSVGDAGVLVKVGGVLGVGIDAAHMPGGGVESGEGVLVRLLFVDVGAKRVVGSLLESWVERWEPRDVQESWKVGMVMKSLKVELVKPGFGITMSCEGEDEESYVPVVAHISCVTDTKDVKLENRFHKGMVLTNKARVIGISRVDGILRVDMRPSILKRKALSLDEVVEGELYDCRIVSHTTRGSLSVAVDGDPRLVGIVPRLQVSDVEMTPARLTKQQKFQVGASLPCRALFVNNKKGNVILSSRNSMISPKFPLLTSFGKIETLLKDKQSNPKGTIFTGYVNRYLKDCSVVVSFCGNVVGKVPISELCVEVKEDLADMLEEVESLYPIGQTVNVRVTKVDSKMRRVWLSMNLSVENNKGKKLSVAFQLGKIVKGTVTKVDNSGKHFIISVPEKQLSEKKVEDKAVVGLTAGREGAPDGEMVDMVECHLPFGHLSDVPGMSEKLTREMKNTIDDKGDEISIQLKGLLLLSTRDGVPTLTMKQSLKDAVHTKRLPGSFEDVLRRVGNDEDKDTSPALLRGYVKALLPAGVIIGFLGDVVGFARINRIADHFVSDPVMALKINQSVSTILDSVDKEKKRFLLSLRPSDVGNEGLAADTISLFDSFSKWRNFLHKSNTEKDFHIGSVINVPAGKQHAYGFLYKLKSASDEDVQGVALDVHGSGPGLAEGEAISLVDEEKGTEEKDNKRKKKLSKEGKRQMEAVRVLDVDPLSGVVDLSRDTIVVDGGRKKSNLHTGSNFNASVLLVKSGYLILAVKRSKTRCAVAFALGPTVSDNLAVCPGMSVECTVLDKSPVGTARNLVLIDWKSFHSSSLRNIPKLRMKQSHSDYKETISLLLSSDNTDETVIAGRRISGKVSQKFSMHAFVSIAKGVVGHLHVSNVSTLTDEETSSLSLGIASDVIASRFALPQKGTILKQAFVAGIRRAAEDDETGPMVIEVSLSEQGCKRKTVAVGQRVLGFIKNLSAKFDRSSEQQKTGNSYSYTKVTISPSIVVSCRDVDCLFPDTDVSLTVASPVLCLITSVEDGVVRAALSENGNVAENEFYTAIVMAKLPGVGLRIEIPWQARPVGSKERPWGVVSLCDVYEDFDQVADKFDSVKEGDLVRVRNVACLPNRSDEKDSEIVLSMRNVDEQPRDPLITIEGVSKLEKGVKVRGFVRKTNKNGCFVAIGRNVFARVLLYDLADDFVKDPEKAFPVGMLVEGVIGKVSSFKGKVHISLILRKRPRKTLKEVVVNTDLKEGQKVEGTVTRVQAYGALVYLSKGVTALLHKSEADQDRYIKNPTDEWVVGQKLVAIVIKSDEKGIKLGTKRCYFEAANIDDEQTDLFLARNEKSKEDIVNGREDSDTNMVEEVEVSDKMDYEAGNDEASEENDEENKIGDITMETGDVEEDNFDSEKSVKGNHQGSEGEAVIPLNIEQSFDFRDKLDNVGTGETSADGSGDEKSDREEEPKKKTSRDKREKKRQREAEETAIRLREEALANDPDSPETADDFERLLIGEPNSSVLWIRYMAFCVSLSQVDKARSIAERAIEIISLDKESERMNIWLAYMNLEAQYGASNAVGGNASDGLGFKRDAAVFRVFDRGCERVTDVEHFHLQAASGLRGFSAELADEVLRRAIRRFKGSKDVWIANGLAQFKCGNKVDARRTLEKALMSLEKREHVAVISKFAQFEYKFGSPERGRTVFESLAGNFPKRLDLWNIYLDMETSQCRQAAVEKQEELVETTRSLFERVTTLELSSKKMKFLFQKWLGFEKLFGNKEEKSHVKDRAREFVERVTAVE